MGEVLAATALVAVLGACTSSSPKGSGTTTPSGSTTTTSGSSVPSTSSTTASGPQLAGQPGATLSNSGYVAGYQETPVEAEGLRLLQTYEQSDVTPASQVHCPGVGVSVGTTLVCLVATPSSGSNSLYEPLKVDAVSPLKLEFAIIFRNTFVCAAHAAWVVQATSAAGIHCTTQPTGQGQGQGQ